MTAKAALELEPNFSDSYLRRAFVLQYNLILLGGAVLFSLASASALPLLIGLALEVAWLGLAPNVPALRRLLDQPTAELEAPALALPVALAAPAPPPRPSFDAAHAARAAAFDAALVDIRQLGTGLELPSQRHAASSLEVIGRSFTGLCENHQKLARYLTGTPESAFHEEIERMKRAFSAEKDLGLRLAIRQGMALAQRRLDQRAGAEKSLRTISMRLETLERAVGALRAQAHALGLNQELLAELDALRHELGTDTVDEETVPRSSLIPFVT